MVEQWMETPPATGGEGSSYSRSVGEISVGSNEVRRATRASGSRLAKRLSRISAALASLSARHVRLPLQALWLRVSLLAVVASLSAVTVIEISDEHRTLTLSSSYDTDTLKAALSESPNQHQVHSRLGLFYLYDPLELDAERALRHFQQAARLNPFDFNSWMNLGRGYDETGELSKAETAYHQAIQLAPNYFLPRWLYANFLLRHGQAEQAFAEFPRVADINPDATENICELIWQSSANGADEIAKLGHEIRSQKAKQSICQFLITRASHTQALSVWNELSWDEPFKPALTRQLVSGLMSVGEYDHAQRVWRELVSRLDRSADSADQLFWNGDFERELPHAEPPTTNDQRPTTYSFFNGLDWTIESSDEVKASIVESEKYDGANSLMLEFLKPERVNFSGVYHYLIVQPSAKYRLRFRYKTREMLPESGLRVEIEAVASRLSLVASQKAITSDQRLATSDQETDWTLATVEFETPPDTRAVIVRIVRKPRESYYDFVKGKIWFDSFTVEPLSVHQ